MSMVWAWEVVVVLALVRTNSTEGRLFNTPNTYHIHAGHQWLSIIQN